MQYKELVKTKGLFMVGFLMVWRTFAGWKTYPHIFAPTSPRSCVPFRHSVLLSLSISFGFLFSFGSVGHFITSFGNMRVHSMRCSKMGEVKIRESDYFLQFPAPFLPALFFSFLLRFSLQMIIWCFPHPSCAERSAFSRLAVCWSRFNIVPTTY